MKFFNFLSLIFDSVFRFRDSISRFCIPCELLCAAAAAEFLACVAGGSTIGVLKSRFPTFFSSQSRYLALFHTRIPIPPHFFTRFYA